MNSRPLATDTEEDILQLQQSFLQQKGDKPAATVIRVQKKSSGGSNPPQHQDEKKDEPKISQSTSRGERFVLDVDALEQRVEGVLFGIQERRVAHFTNEVLQAMAEEGAVQFSKEDGFPDILNLSAYYSSGTGDSASGDHEKLTAPVGCSFFAAEFDRLHGRIADNIAAQDAEIGDEEERMNQGDNDFEAENERRLQAMSGEELDRAREEIEERLEPALLSWLRDRHKKRAAPSPVEEKEKEEGVKPKKVSRFKRERIEAATTTAPKVEGKSTVDGSISTKANQVDTPIVPPPVEELIGNLEILDEYGSREDQEKYDRLAIDAVRVDLAARSARLLQPRQQANAIRLFDQLRKGRENAAPDAILDQARASIDDIKSLYLETVEPEEGRPFERFCAGANPLHDSTWMVVPIRRVLDDVYSSKTEPEPSHVDAVRLALLWTVLLKTERPHAFASYADPTEMYVRLSECFLLGPSVFRDDVIDSCLRRLLFDFVLPSAVDGRLTLRMASRVAGLDAFAPFYDDLLRSFEGSSMGGHLFSFCVLLPAYLNASLPDALQARVTLWSPERTVARQLTATAQELAPLISTAKSRSEESAGVMETALFVPFAQLIGVYLAAIRDGRVIRGRNDALFELAADELGRFVHRHTTPSSHSQIADRVKEFDALVNIVRSTMQGKIQL